MPEAIVDLRSDTVTAPSSAMREAMARAPVGDDVYGEDPTIAALENKACELTGKAAALYVPSGSMANLIAQMVYVRRGDEVILGQDSHVLFYESGSGAALAGCLYAVVPGSGLINAADVRARLQAGSFYAPRTALVWLENTHNRAGGAFYPLGDLAAIAALTSQHGLPLHLDGARAFNAAAALGVPLLEIAQHFDSLSFCLSKGLGAPVGTLLCGTAAFRNEALRFRKMLGGAMRQAGIVAAGGLYALQHNVARLADDHANARRLAEQLQGIPGLTVDLAATVTNLVLADVVHQGAKALADRCAHHGVRFAPVTPSRVRFVTHLDVSAADIDRAAAVVRQAMRD